MSFRVKSLRKTSNCIFLSAYTVFFFLVYLVASVRQVTILSQKNGFSKQNNFLKLNFTLTKKGQTHRIINLLRSIQILNAFKYLPNCNSFLIFYPFDRMEVSTQSNIAFDNDESFSKMLMESIDPKNTRNVNELEDARFWLGQLGKIRNIYEEQLLKLADKVERLEVDNKVKVEQLQSAFEEKFREMEYRLQCAEEKYMKQSEQVDEGNNIGSMLKECLVDIRNSK